MFDIEARYKIIFEALFEHPDLDQVLKVVHEYYKTDVFLISNSGEIIAYACGDKGRKISALAKRQVTFDEYEKMPINLKRTDHAIYLELLNSYIHIEEFSIKDKRGGYSIFLFEKEEYFEDIVKINTVLCQAIGVYFKDKKVEIYENIPMRQQISVWTIFSEQEADSEGMQLVKKEITGNYFLIFISCKDDSVDKYRLYQQIQGIWSRSLCKFDEKNICILFYDTNDESRKEIITRLKKLERLICVSELFGDLSVCPYKREYLKRMNGLAECNGETSVVLEKDWYVETTLSYAASEFEKAGIKDYLIEDILREDVEKNLELYDTLKTYFLCENNLNVTANKLHVHRNTLVYRIKQIQNCIAKNINDDNLSKQMGTFMVIHDIREKWDII